jgi:hypothetical protein
VNSTCRARPKAGDSLCGKRLKNLLARLGIGGGP